MGIFSRRNRETNTIVVGAGADDTRTADQRKRDGIVNRIRQIKANIEQTKKGQERVAELKEALELYEAKLVSHDLEQRSRQRANEKRGL